MQRDRTLNIKVCPKCGFKQTLRTLSEKSRGQYVEPYANLRKTTYRSTAYYIMLSSEATRRFGVISGEGVDIDWSPEDMTLTIYRNGDSRTLQKWGLCSRVYVTTMIKKLEIPEHSHRLPVIDVTDDYVVIDFSGEQAAFPRKTRAGNPKALPDDPFKGMRDFKREVFIDGSRSTWFRTVKDFSDLLNVVAGKEGMRSGGRLLERLGLQYIEEEYPELYSLFQSKLQTLRDQQIAAAKNQQKGFTSEEY